MQTAIAPSVVDRICDRVGWCPRHVLRMLLQLATEIAREGREGRRIGALFTLGAADAVLAHSRSLILDPLAGHAPAATHLSDANLRGTLKELAQLDGAFVVSEDGVVRAACRYLDASVRGTTVPFGLGSRHLAAASISRELGILAVVVSETAVVRVFHQGELIAEIIPELWLLGTQISPQCDGRVAERHGAYLTSVAPERDGGDAARAQPLAPFDAIDEALDQSFPASDPPAWVPVLGVRPAEGGE